MQAEQLVDVPEQAVHAELQLIHLLDVLLEYVPVGQVVPQVVPDK